MRRSSLVLTLLPLALLAAPRPAKKPITIDTIAGGGAGARLAGGGGPVYWAPDGQRYAAMESGKLVVIDAASGSSTPLLELKDLEGRATEPVETAPFEWENRRVQEQRVQWSADGKAILLLIKGDLFWVDVAARKAEQLLATRDRERDPKLSPDGKRLSFRRENDLWVLETATKKQTRLTTDGSATRWNARLDWVYPEELDLGTAHWWSPDSQHIAYLQFEVSKIPLYTHVDLLKVDGRSEPERYPKAGSANSDVRLGVIPAKGGKTRWLDIGLTPKHIVARVHWLPNAKEVAAERFTRTQHQLDLVAVDIASGKSRTIFHEEDPYWINTTDDVHFLPGGQQLIRTSEKTGFRHIYVQPVAGGEAKALTQGDWMVQQIDCVDEKAGQIYYTSTEGSPLERHFYAVSLSGGPRRKLSKEAGTHAVSMSPRCSFYFDSHSSLTDPPQRVLAKNDGSVVRVLQERNRKPQEEYEILPSEIHTVKAKDGETLYARLIKPANFDATKKYPAIVSIYGGPGPQTVRNQWQGLGWAQVMAHKGFAVWQLDNRGSSGRGHLFEAKLYRRFGKQELEDQLAGLDYLVGLGFVDPARVGMDGWSYGGYMTLYSLLNAPDRFAAGVAGAPVTDWRLYDTIYTERYLGLPQENETGYKDSSAVTYAKNLKGKLMIVHNTGDDNVLFQNAIMMMNALQLAGKPFESMIYPQKAHGVSGPAARHLLETKTSFFERHLLGRAN